MSNDAVIRVENLGKRYRITHQQPGRGYVALRDVIAQKMKAPFQFLRRSLKLEDRSSGQSTISNLQSSGEASSPISSPSAANSNLPSPNSQLPRTEDFWALRDVSFSVRRGEVVGIIGRNGAGKSTLLKILSRITEPTEGRVRINGRVASLLEVGTGFHPELTGRENIFLNGAILGMTRVEIKKKFDEIVAFAEVEKFLDTPVKRYSSGMYVRLAFALAAHLEPEILIVDEVLAVGDAQFQKKSMGKMEKVALEGRTVIVVSHSMSTVKTLCSSAILLDTGIIRASGPVDAVVTDYLGGIKSDEAERMISDKDHVSGIKWLRVRRIRLVNGVMSRFTVYWQQPISLSVEVEVENRLTDVSFGAGVKTVGGAWVFVVHHDDHGIRPPWTLNPGKHVIKLTLQNNLSPGIYKLCVGAHRQVFGGAGHDGILCEAANLEVLGCTEQGLTSLPYNTGVVNGVSTWEGPELLS